MTLTTLAARRGGNGAEQEATGVGRGAEHCWDDVIGPDERLIASRYEKERPLGTRPALLMIDCYAKVFGDRPQPLAEAIDEWPATCGLNAWESLPSIEKLLTGAREAGIPVVHTTGEAHPGSRLGAATQRSRVQGEDDVAGYAFMPSLAPLDGELMVRKSRASAFFGTPVSTWLRQLDVDTLFVAGESTSGCVRASVVDAYSAGFRVAVVEEAVFDRSTLSHKVNLFDMNLKYAAVLHLDDVLGHLSR
ncbi:MAG: isochorismatase family protein [Actinomycetota bacterium]|nr:isochorismatase family protein [Actinomycetota bacterium]MDP9459509.1 isochorismatase family protein [Actinomycetota bacterium]